MKGLTMVEKKESNFLEARSLVKTNKMLMSDRASNVFVSIEILAFEAPDANWCPNPLTQT